MLDPRIASALTPWAPPAYAPRDDTVSIHEAADERLLATPGVLSDFLADEYDVVHETFTTWAAAALSERANAGDKVAAALLKAFETWAREAIDPAFGCSRHDAEIRRMEQPV